VEERNNVKVGMKAADIAGMISDADPRDLPRNQFQIIENLALEHPGDAISRRGMRIRHTAPFTANLTATKRSHTVFNVGLWNWLAFDVANGSFRVIDATSGSTTNYTFTPTAAWHSEAKMCFAKTSGGELIVVNGIDRPWKFNGLPGTTVTGEGPACPMGIDPPTAAPSATLSGGGNAEAGVYRLAYRFVDRFGNPSVLSPVVEKTAAASNQFAWTFAKSTGLDSSGRVVKRELFRTLVGNFDTYYRVTTVNDNSTTTYTDTLSDDDLADDSRTDYAALPLVNNNGTLNANRFVVPPTHKKVVIWDEDRAWFMADGSYSTGTITGALVTGVVGGATNATPISISDTAHGLSTGDVVTITGVGGNTAANGTFGIVRTDADNFTLNGSVGNGAYTSGGTWTKINSGTITGSGTTFTDEMVNWEIWPNGTGTLPYKITAVGSATSVTVTPGIDTAFTGVTYVARPNRTERNTIYASEPEEPESAPQSQNGVLIQYSAEDDDDEIVGGFSNSRGLFVLKNRSTYSVDYVRQGKLSASAARVAERGAFNQDCRARAGGREFLLDYDGPWQLNGAEDNPIGDAFGNYFREGLVDFTKADTFFVAANRRTHVVRFYVVLTADASTYPKFCFCYNYRLDRWWTETRPWEVTGAGSIREGYKYTYYELPYGGYPMVYDDGYAADGVTAAVRGTVSTYNSGSGALVATGSIFTNAMVGASIVVTSGSGKRSTGIISAYTSGTAVTVTAGFHSVATPAAGDTFVIGGIPWKIKSGQLDIPMAGGERVPIEMRVSFVPTTNDNQSLDLRHYLNHKSTAENAATPQAEQADTVATVSGSPDATFSMYASKNAEGTTVGVAKKTLSGVTTGSLGSDRLITVEVRGIAAEERHYIRQIDCTGVS
jgi:hypothetical protein